MNRLAAARPAPAGERVDEPSLDPGRSPPVARDALDEAARVQPRAGRERPRHVRDVHALAAIGRASLQTARRPLAADDVPSDGVVRDAEPLRRAPHQPVVVAEHALRRGRDPELRVESVPDALEAGVGQGVAEAVLAAIRDPLS